MSIAGRVTTKQGTFFHPWLLIRRHLFSLLAQLRGKLAACLLVVLLGLSLSEPLFCVIHCQIWLPIAYRNYHAMMHHNHHVQTSAQLAPAHTSTNIGESSTSMPQCASFGPTGSQIPFYVPPSPVHDLAPVMLSVVILLLLLALALPAAPPIAPLQLAPPRLLRPPKAILI